MKAFQKRVVSLQLEVFDLIISATCGDWTDEGKATLSFQFFHKPIKKQYVGCKGQTMDETQFNNIYEESRVHKTYNDTMMKNMSSLEILCKASDGKCWTEKKLPKK